jgi:nitrogen fixation protein NifU and related proteins
MGSPKDNFVLRISSFRFIRAGRMMSQMQEMGIQDPESIRELLSSSGYADKAIEYFLDRKNMGTIPDADQVSELTGPCGDTMKIYLKVDDGRIQDAKIQVLGCPGAVASAMAAMELIRGMTMDEAMKVKDGEVFSMLEDLPDQKQHCIRLTVKTLQKAIEEYKAKNGKGSQGA